MDTCTKAPATTAPVGGALLKPRSVAHDASLDETTLWGHWTGWSIEARFETEPTTVNEVWHLGGRIRKALKMAASLEVVSYADGVVRYRTYSSSGD